jgi:hypothetical protein
MLLSEHMKILGADTARHEHHLLYMPIFACTGQRLQLRLFQPMPKRTGGTMRRFRRSAAFVASLTFLPQRPSSSGEFLSGLGKAAAVFPAPSWPLNHRRRNPVRFARWQWCSCPTIHRSDTMFSFAKIATQSI